MSACACGAATRDDCGWLHKREDVARVGCHVWAEVGKPILKAATFDEGEVVTKHEPS